MSRPTKMLPCVTAGSYAQGRTRKPMKMLAVHVCPLWQEESGQRVVGLSVRDDHPPVVGWVNVGMVRLGDEVRLFLLTKAASDG